MAVGRGGGGGRKLKAIEIIIFLFEDLSSGMQQHVARRKSADVSDEHVASIIRIEKLGKQTPM
jgi:hypothetical protein